MLKKKKIGHYQYNSDSTKTPQQRAEYFGAINYSVGENVLSTSYNCKLKTKQGRIINTNTYEALATSIVTGWVNSPGHFKNIITQKYQITGVAISLDIENKTIYASQEFATVRYKYIFSENKNFFNYSNISDTKPVNSFDNISNKLLNHPHNWELKHDDLSKCIVCNRIEKNHPDASIKIKNNNFILKFENSEFVKQIIQNKYDGFAIEILEFNDYMCGNPEYYTKPSIRNGQCKANGRILKPVYRNNLIKGFKKRRRNKNIKFLSYIFGADSVKFSERFFRFKIEKYNSKYFEISLGKVPKNYNGMVTASLVYIQDKQICNVSYGRNYEGELFSEYKTPEFIPLNTDIRYSFKSDTINLKFEIPFEKNKYVFTDEDIAPFIDSISKFDYKIDSISITSYSSIEGDSLINNELQLQRAKSIINILNKNKTINIRYNIKYNTSWEHFYKNIKKSSKWKFLAKLDKNQIQDEVNNKYSKELEYILKKERKGKIELFGSIPVENNIKHYIDKEYEFLLDTLYKIRYYNINYKYFLYKFSNLYKFTYKNVINNVIDTAYLANVKFPQYFNRNTKITEQFIMYGYQFNKHFKQNELWVNKKDFLSKKLISSGLEHLQSAFIYNDCRIKSEKLKLQKSISQDMIQDIFDETEHLKGFYYKDSLSKINIEKINFNLNMFLLNKVFTKDVEEKKEEAEKSIIDVFTFYKIHNLLTPEIAIKLSKLAMIYTNRASAKLILSKYLNNDKAKALYMNILYEHPSINNTQYFKELRELSNTIDINIWCNMFLLDNMIPFTAFDDDKLRKIFCKKCMDKNKLILKLKEH